MSAEPASLLPRVGCPLVLVLTATAAGTRAVCGSRSFGLSAGLTDVQVLQTAPGKSQG